MPTFLNSFLSSEIKVRFKEPYVTAAIDQKVARVQPRGTYRGFLLTTSALNLTVTVQAEASSGKHIAVYETADGYSLRIARSADFDLDLNVPALLGKTVVLAIYADYTLNANTRAEIRAYELSPVDEFTIAPEKGELVVLGTVVVPGAGLITNIDSSYRTMAWEDGAPEARDWVQFVENGGFEIAHVNTITPASGSVDVAEMVPGWDTFTSVGMRVTGGLVASITNTQQHTGRNSLRLQMSGLANQSLWLRYAGTAQVRPGQRVKGSIWVKGVLLNPGPTAAPGILGLVLGFFRTDGVSVSYVEISDPTLTGSFGWTELSDIVTVPALAATMYAYVYYEDNNQSSTGDLYFDDIRVWLEPDPPSQDSIREEELNQGSKRLEVLDILPAPASPMLNLATTIARAIRLRGSGYSGGITNLVMSCRDHLTEFALRLLHGDLQVDKAILGLGRDLIGSVADAAKPRIQSPIPAVATAKYTLLWEITNAGSAGNLRIYASDSNLSGRNALIFTSNAEWSSPNWDYDSGGDLASRIDFTADGFSFYSRASGGAAWADADWDDGVSGDLLLYATRTALHHLTQTIIGALHFHGLTSTDAFAGTPRILMDAAPSATSVFTLLWQVDLAAANVGPLRFYSAEASSIPSTFTKAGLFITNNCWWDQSALKWTADDATDEAYLFAVSADGFAYYRMPTTYTVAPWSSTDWMNPSKGIPILEIVSKETDDRSDTRMNNARVRIINSDAFTNPAKTTNPYANALYAKNLVKAWGHFSTDGLGGITLEEGFGIDGLNCSVLGSTASIALFDLMDSVNYAVVPSVKSIVSPNANLAYRAICVGPAQAVGSFQLQMFKFVFDGPSDHVDFWDFTAGGVPAEFSVVVMGQQTT